MILETLILLVALLAALAFFIGLIRPQFVRMPSRLGSSVIYGIIFICATTLGATFYPTEKNITEARVEAVDATPKEPAKFEQADMLLGIYRKEPKEKRHEIVSNYIKFKGVPDSDAGGFYACLSEYTFTKANDLALGEVLDWCEGDYNEDPSSLAKRVNLDAFQSNFSGWDGSYRPLEKLIKQEMNDDSSYKHVSTTYRLLLGNDPHAVVKTTFRGTNAYGGVVKQAVAARVDIRTGDIVQIVKD